MKIISIDIGSTWTKGGLFNLNNEELVLEKHAEHKTTTHNLADGFFHVLQKLAPNYKSQLKNEDIKLFYSSSAKGGLSVAALGIVPEITLETAKIAAFSAGAKISSFFSYQLTERDIQKLRDSAPDIILFTGGTDGGNADYVLSNAKQLANLEHECSIIYAGNRSIADPVAELLINKELYIVDNVLPELDTQNPEPAREAMRSIFLSKIVKGKGLDKIIEQVKEQPVPTPFAIHELTKHISNNIRGWQEFMLLDLGGATTDIYSSHQEQPDTGTVIRGIPEPKIKRTVEGDLGMRVSAQAAIESGKPVIQNELKHSGLSETALNDYAEQITKKPEHIGKSAIDQRFDQIIAGNCISNACSRHTGRMHQVATADGLVNVQTGRNLSRVSKIIGSGGYLSQANDFNPATWLNKQLEDNKGRRVLLPSCISYYRDEQYLIPLLANIAQGFPEAAALATINYLCPLQTRESKPKQAFKTLF